MKSIMWIFMALMGINLINATPTKTNNTTPAPLANYTVMDLEWVITINSSLPDIIVTGTIQDVVAHLGNIYPSYVATLKEIISNKKTRDYREEGATKQGATISSRQTATDYYCSIFRDAQYDDIQAGISYLNRLNGRPSMGPGPGTCGRVSCSWNSAIWWCNDNAQTKSLSSFSDIATGAQDVMNHCTTTEQGESVSRQVNGQQFFQDGWNVIVAGADC